MMMDNGDFIHTFPTRGDLSCKSLGDNISNAGNSSCSSPASVVLRSDERNEPSESYSVIIKDLHDEIDRVQMTYREVEAMLQALVKPILDQMYAGASKLVTTPSALDGSVQRESQLNRHVLLHIPSLQELLLKLGFSKNWDELQNYLVSSDRTVLLSETDALRRELRNARSRHDTVIKCLHRPFRSVEQEHRLQPKLVLSEGDVHSMEQKLSTFERPLLSLQQDLMCSIEISQSLQKTLECSDRKLRSLHQDPKESGNTGQSVQQSLQDSREKNQSLHHTNQSSFEKNSQSLSQELSASEKNVEFPQESNLKSEEKIKSLEQTLSSFREKVSLLQRSLTSSEERAQNLQRNLQASEDNLQWMQHLLKTADEKSNALNEALRSSREKSDTLKQALGKSKEEHENRIESWMQTLRISEERHHSAMQNLQIGLHSAREKVAILQNALERTESAHAEDVEKLQHKLNRATKKFTSTEQELYSQTVALNTQLLEEQSNTSKKLERSCRYQKEMQDTIKDLRKKLNIQTEKGVFALNCLMMCQKDLADVHRQIQGDLLRCNQVCGLENGPEKDGLKQELFNLRYTLNNILEKEAGREKRRRHGRMQMLDKSKEWETKAEQLVDTLDYFQSKQVQKEERNESDRYIDKDLRRGTSCLPLSLSAIPERNLSTRPASPYPYV
ncbi:hypothetical protein DPEC_G00269010 [Dallia pectoralis]|uniref:Uncharacterized protein n=1 Tax=Dallia pectoralis TaxID=75939 RepID=A0ACC2FNY1_DALPE|nr:hypothetical protein DPEC_G00269010 [Dallia pectoralis]